MTRQKEELSMNALSTGEKTGIRTLSINIVRSIAEQHGGTIERDQATESVSILVPEDSRDLCTEEICQQLDALREYLVTTLLACFCGKVFLRINKN